jgi:DNA (cytosine-5)-methyltransferase 1
MRMIGMRVLDLYCGAGGAGHGYWLAGHSVLGVDLWPQPEYPHPMIEADALSFLKLGYLGSFDVIHASPPCLASTALNKGTNGRARIDSLPRHALHCSALGCPTSSRE